MKVPNQWKCEGHKLYIVRSIYPTGKYYFGFMTEDREGYCNITQEDYNSKLDVITLDSDFIKTGNLARKFIKTYCKKIRNNMYKVNLDNLLPDTTKI